MTPRKPAKRKPGEKMARISCRLIQWAPGKTIFVDNKPFCPECNGPAEAIVSFFGSPGYAHVILGARR